MTITTMRVIGDAPTFPVGLGSMTLTQTPTHDPAKAVDVIAAAVEAGITLFDTADCYGPTGDMGVNERALIGALRNVVGSVDEVLIATKGGHTRGPNATWWLDGRPEHIARAARDSLRRLGLETLPLYQHHRPDPKVPYAETMGAFRQLVDEGLVQRVGVSNVDVHQLDIAAQELGDALVSVQNEFSPAARSSENVLRECERRGLAFLAWGPLGGMRAAKSLAAGVGAIAAIAKARGVSPQRVTLAWLLSKSPQMIVIPGASRPASVQDSAQAADLRLSDEELAAIERDHPSNRDPVGLTEAFTGQIP